MTRKNKLPRNRNAQLPPDSRENDPFDEAKVKISGCLDEAKRLSNSINGSLNNMNQQWRLSEALRFVAVNIPLVRAELAGLRMAITAAIEAKNR